MKSNALLKWLMIPVLALLVYAGPKLLTGSKDGANAPDASTDTSALTPEEMRTLGVGGDTPRDTLATLVAQVKQLRNELATATAQNQQHTSENQRLRQREGALEQRMEQALQTERERAQKAHDDTASEQ